MRTYTYKNLLDYILEMLENPDYNGKPAEQFRNLLSSYFFKDESKEKPIAAFFKTMDIPGIFTSVKSLLEITPESIKPLTDNELPGETIAGKLMTSKQYLKVYYSNHQPDFQKIPPDIRMEILDKIQNKNSSIQSSFVKMNEDIEADKKRTILKLTALILNNIHKKTGIPFNKLDENAETVLRSHIRNGNSLFEGKPADIADIGDESKIKDLIKEFFVIKQHKDLVEYSDLFKMELKRYQRRVKIRQ